MSSGSRRSRRCTRRGLIKSAAGIGLGLAGAMVAPSADLAVIAIRDGSGPRAGVRIGEVSDRSSAEFALGKPSGSRIAGSGTSAALRGTAGATFESRAIPAPLEATHIGLHWKGRGARPSDLLLSVRGSRNGHDWSPWQRLSVEAISCAGESNSAVPVHGPAPPQSNLNEEGIEVFAALIGMNRPKFLQYQVQFQSERWMDIDEVLLTAIDASAEVDDDSASLFQTTRAQEAPVEVTLRNPAGVEISVITREGWGADESFRFDSEENKRWPEMYVPVKKVFLHHTATSNNYSDGKAEVRAIYAYHTQTVGFGDIGYNMLVDRFGNIYEGRHGRGERSLGDREVLSPDVVAGHVFAYNYGTTGIAAIGNSQQGQWNRFWADTGLNAIVDAVAFECGRHYLNPQDESDYLRSDRVWHQGMLAHCAGHQDADGDGGATACPGRRLYDFLNDELRGRVAQRLGSATDAPAGLDGTQSGDTLEFDWNADSVDGFHFFLEGWWKESGQEDITYLTGYAVDSGYDDIASDPREWVWDSETISGPSEAFDITEPGHYTLHVRTASEGFAYASHHTVLVENLDDTGDPEEPETGTISGTVTNPDAEPVVGAAVRIENTDLSTSTDDDGNYSFEDVDAGTYQVSVEAEGYEPTSSEVVVESGTVVELDFTLEPVDGDDGGGNTAESLLVADMSSEVGRSGPDWSATVTITVVDNLGEPVEGAIVSGQWSGGYQGSETTSTDQDGTCQVTTGSIPNREKSVTFTVTEIEHELAYDESESVTSITVER